MFIVGVMALTIVILTFLWGFVFLVNNVANLVKEIRLMRETLDAFKDCRINVGESLLDDILGKVMSKLDEAKRKKDKAKKVQGKEKVKNGQRKTEKGN